jgi:hypothetical protein
MLPVCTVRRIKWLVGDFCNIMYRSFCTNMLEALKMQDCVGQYF